MVHLKLEGHEFELRPIKMYLINMEIFPIVYKINDKARELRLCGRDRL